MTLIGIGALIFRVIIAFVPTGFILLGLGKYRTSRKKIHLILASAGAVLFLLTGNNFLNYTRNYYFLHHLSQQKVERITINKQVVDEPASLSQLIATLNQVQWSDHKPSSSYPLYMSIKMTTGQVYQYHVVPYSGGPGAVIRNEEDEAHSVEICSQSWTNSM